MIRFLPGVITPLNSLILLEGGEPTRLQLRRHRPLRLFELAHGIGVVTSYFIAKWRGPPLFLDLLKNEVLNAFLRAADVSLVFLDG